MNFEEKEREIENKILSFQEKDRLVFGSNMTAQQIMVKLDDLLFLQQVLFEEAMELMPEVDNLLDISERFYKDKQLVLYQEIASDQTINKSNRLTILELKSAPYKAVVDGVKLLKHKIENLIEKEKERLWTLRAMKKSFM